MNDRSDGSVVEFRTNSGRKVRGVTGDASLYDTLAERHGWPDKSEVEGLGERLAPVLRGESRDISSTGGLSGNIPAPARALVLDRLVSQTFLSEAGAVFISPESETLAVSRVDSGAGLEWISPGSSASSTDPSFTSQTLDFKTFRGKIDINRETVQDAADLPDVVEREVTATMREELERVCLVGSGTGEEPLGVTESTDINSVNFGGSTNGSAPEASSTGGSWVDVLQAKQRLMDDNVPEDNISITWAPRTERQFSALQDSQNRFLEPPSAVRENRRFVTSAMPTTFAPGSLTGQSKAVVGDWTGGLVGVRLEPTVEIFRSVESNKYQLSVVPAMRLDFVPQRPDSFEVIERIST